MRQSLARNILARLAVPAFAWSLLVAAWPAHAAVVCSQSVPAVAVLDPGDSHSALPDITVACSGGAPADPAISTNLQVFFSATLLTDVLPTLSDGSATYAGVLAGANSALFAGIPIVPLATTLTLGDFFVDATALASGFTLTELLSLSGATPVALSNPTLALAVVGEPTATVPEPGTLSMLVAAGLALLGLRLARRPGAVGHGADPAAA